jgi:putative ABC transport system ATP-binding protein
MTGKTAPPRPVGAAAAVRCVDVDKIYGEEPSAVHAVRKVNLEVGFGEFVVVLGPSGSGKTTLLNLIGAIEPPTSGRILVAGTDIAGFGERERTAHRRERIGFVFQFFNLVPTLTARENVQLIAELVTADPGRRTEEVLTHVGLADQMDRFPGQLSGGEQQRVAIGRAIVKEPPLLLCDEPTGSLDLATGRHVLAALRALAREGHHTVLLVTHNSEISRMADRVLRMSSGELIEDRRVERPVEAQDLDW